MFVLAQSSKRRPISSPSMMIHQGVHHESDARDLIVILVWKVVTHSSHLLGLDNERRTVRNQEA